MKINNKLITQDGKVSAKEQTNLNLSNLNINLIENLENCVNLRHLTLSHNEIDGLCGLEKCKQLWRLEINNNRVKSLDGLSKFIAFGTLNFHGNDICWTELEKIRHLHIVDITITGNPRLDKDQNYRYHLIDCLPNAWIIDGLLVTAGERQEAQNFFEESALTIKPVRRKLPKDQFIPSELKTRNVFGDWATKLLSKFPVNEVKNIETDIRRLEFMAEWFEEIILDECLQQTNRKNNKHDPNIKPFDFQPTDDKIFLKQLIEFRKSNAEICNMILVLLIASVQFELPIDFINEMLNFTSLNMIKKNINYLSDSFETIKLFRLPNNCRLRVASLLLSAAKIDRDQNIEAGFYENLFQSLKNLLNESLRALNDGQEKPTTTNQNNTILQDNKSLLATEIIQLFCIVPLFYELLPTNKSLMTILRLSVGDVRIFEAIQNLLNLNQSQNKSSADIAQELGLFITNLLKFNARQLLNKKSKRKKSTSLLSNTSDTSSYTNDSFTAVSSNTNQNNQTSVVTTTNGPKAKNETNIIQSNHLTPKVEPIKKCPVVGESLLIGKKRLGRIVKLEKSDIGLVHFENCNLNDLIGESNDESGSTDNSLLVELKYFEWDPVKKYWKPENSTGDLNTFSYNGSIDLKNLIVNKKTKTDSAKVLCNQENQQQINSKTSLAVLDESIINDKSTFSKIEIDVIEKSNENEKKDDDDDDDHHHHNDRVDEDQNNNIKIVVDEVETLDTENGDNHIQYNVQEISSSRSNVEKKPEHLNQNGNSSQPTNSPISPRKIVNFSTNHINSKQLQTIVPLRTAPLPFTSIKPVLSQNHHHHQSSSSSSSMTSHSNQRQNQTHKLNKLLKSTVNHNRNKTTSRQSTGKTSNLTNASSNSIMNESTTSEFMKKWNNNDSINLGISYNNSPRLNIPSSTDSLNQNGLIMSANNYSNEQNNSKFHITLPTNSDTFSYNEIIEPIKENANSMMINIAEIQENEPFTNSNDPNEYETLVELLPQVSPRVISDRKLFNSPKYPTRNNKSDKSSSASSFMSKSQSNNQINYDQFARQVSPSLFSTTNNQQTSNNSNPIVTSLDNYDRNEYDNYYYFQAINYGNSLNNREKKIIKLQDCTTWLSMDNKKSIESIYFKNNSSFINSQQNSTYRRYSNSANNSPLPLNNYSNSYQYLNGIKMAENTDQAKTQLNIARISALINRRTNRANTNPKVPILKSPSSQAHMMCKGLRPTSVTIDRDFHLTTKRIEVPFKNFK